MPKSSNKPLPFEQLAKAIESRRSVYGAISGLRLDRAAFGEAWSSLPYRPVFVGDTATGVLHGGVVTAMLDESCGMAVQLALDRLPGIRGQSGRDRDGVLHDRRKPDQHADRQADEWRRGADAGRAGGF